MLPTALNARDRIPYDRGFKRGAGETRAQVVRELMIQPRNGDDAATAAGTDDTRMSSAPISAPSQPHDWQHLIAHSKQTWGCSRLVASRLHCIPTA